MSAHSTDSFSHVYLPHGYVAIIDDADLGLVSTLTLYRGKNGYVYYSIWKAGKSRPATYHGLLLKAPPGMHVDHINGDKLDNRRCNLRVVTYQINQVNRKRLNRNNVTGSRGVGYRPNLSPSKPWRVQIMVNRRNKHVGLFATKNEAILARREAEMRYFGETCP